MDEGRELLANLPLLQFVPPDARRLVIDSFVRVSFGFGQPIVTDGMPADAFYVVARGSARVVKAGLNGEEVSLALLRPGDSFGEMALLEETTRSASVRASGDVEVLRLDRTIFHALVRANPEIRTQVELQVKHRHLNNFFRLYSPFAKLPPAAQKTLLTELKPLTVAAGQMVIQQGDEPGPMYIIEEGRLRVFVEEDGRHRYIRYLRKGDFFGEMSLFKGTGRTASVEAAAACTLLALAPETFERLVNEYPAFKTQIEARIQQYDYEIVARVPLDFSEEMLPAELSVRDKVGADQVERSVEDGPFASPDGHFVKKGQRIRRLPFVQQIDEMDCGAASLAMVCRHFGRAVSLARIRQLVHTALDGTSLSALCRAATELGLAARSVKASARTLAEMPLPAIVHWQGNHWVVLYDVRPGHVRVADPALGFRRFPRAEFEAKWTGYAALFDYTAAFEAAPEGRSSYAWLWTFVQPFRGALAKAVVLAVMVSASQMLLPVFTQVIVDKVVVEGDVGLLHVVVLAMLGVLVFMTVALVVQRYLLSFAAVRIDASSLDFLMRRLLALPMTYFATRRTGDIQRRLEGLRRVREFLVQHGVVALTAAVQILAAVALMVVYSPLLALVFLATAPIYVLMMRFSSKKLRPIFADLEEGFGRYHSYQIDAIKGIETVKAVAGEGGFRHAMLAQFHTMARRQFHADFTVMVYDGAIQVVTLLSMTLFLWVGAHQVMAGALTIGALVAFNSLVALANAPIVTLLNLWDNVQVAGVLMNRLNDIFEQEPEQGADRSGLLPVRTLEGRVRFENLGFRYGGPEAPAILEAVSFDVPPGKMVAIVGRSGSGKTTLIKCLAGLLEPTEGTIYYDGVDLRKLNHRDLRRQVGFVLQENHLFDDTIARNIGFGEDEPDMERVLWAARVASAHEFIERLPLGYDTRVGESGLALSGGQRQRIAIARALYNRPPVLVFDEATSSLDTESERAIKENLDRLLKGRTAFVIAHRLSTIRDADFIAVLEKGRLVELGAHDELMQRQGLYYYLVSQQLGL
ncbi:MAG: peptidase domain-containing ABC transporter [Candidatus Rokuibacteriota bacterium]